MNLRRGRAPDRLGVADDGQDNGKPDNADNEKRREHLPVAVARELHFSRGDVVPFQPAGLGATKEWIQIDRENAADYEKDLELFRQSLEFVKSGGR